MVALLLCRAGCGVQASGFEHAAAAWLKPLTALKTHSNPSLCPPELAEVTSCKLSQNPAVFASNWVPLWAGAAETGSPEVGWFCSRWFLRLKHN